MSVTDPQPAPQNVGAAIVPLVIEDLTARREFGRKKYGDELRVTNGRDALVDAYQEALDLVIYLRQRIEQDRNTDGETHMSRKTHGEKQED